MPGKWLFVDISHMKSQSFGNLQYWLLAIDNATDYSFSLFLKTKEQWQKQWFCLSSFATQRTLSWRKSDAITPRENAAFQAKAKKEGLGLHFEFTACQTPQQNSHIECKFATFLEGSHNLERYLPVDTCILPVPASTWIYIGIMTTNPLTMTVAIGDPPIPQNTPKTHHTCKGNHEQQNGSQPFVALSQTCSIGLWYSTYCRTCHTKFRLLPINDHDHTTMKFTDSNTQGMNSTTAFSVSLLLT